jgi:hypothetical protein
VGGLADLGRGFPASVGSNKVGSSDMGSHYSMSSMFAWRDNGPVLIPK